MLIKIVCMAAEVARHEIWRMKLTKKKVSSNQAVDFQLKLSQRSFTDEDMPLQMLKVVYSSCLAHLLND